MINSRNHEAAWAKAWADRYGAAEPARSRRALRHRRGGGRRSSVLASSALLTLLVAPLAALAQGGGDTPDATTAGNSRGEAVEIQVRNRSRGETGLVTSSDDYSLRLSNTKENGGGGAVYGCRAPSRPPNDNLACLYADNLRGGKAFLFRTRQGGPAGHIEVGDANQAPFTTNGRGLVENLNAERVGGFTAQQLLQSTPGDPVPGAKGDKGDTGPRGPSDGFAATDALHSNLTGTGAEIITLALPAGSFIVNADLQLDNDEAAATSAACELLGNGSEIDDIDSVSLDATAAGANEDESVAMGGGVTLAAAGAVTIECSSPGANVDVHDTDVTAVQVASLTGP